MPWNGRPRPRSSSKNPAGDVVEEVAVVRHGDDGPLVVAEKALEPVDGFGVEMVGRLVEEEQVGRLQKHATERDTAALAARERGDVTVAVGEPQRVHRPVERRLERPGVPAVDLVLHLRLLGEEDVVVGVRLGEGGGDRVETVEQVAELADAVLDVAAHVLARVELRLLLEQPDGRPGGELRLAVRGLLTPRHDPQQRRLAGTVRPEHPDFRAVEERERDVREHLPVRPVELVGPIHRVDELRHAVLPGPAALPG